jgi:parallel beta-helix repeat protein
MNNVMSASAAAQCNVIETGYGINVVDSSNVTVSRNEITGFGIGVEFDNVHNLVFTWNMVIGSLGDGAYFNVGLANISNNVFSRSGNVGVVFENSDQVTFANNEISRSGSDGLLIIGSGLVTIVNGVYVDNGGFAIFTNMTSGQWIINGNTTIMNGAIFFAGDLTVVSGGILTLVDVDFALASDGDCLSVIEVMAGGKLIMINVDLYMANFGLNSNMNDYYEFNVLGTLRMLNSAVGGALELYLGAHSTVDIETSTIYEMLRNGIHIVDCSPVIISSTIVSNPWNGIFIEGTSAAPQITD